jgi:hypothetical protein
MSAVAARSGEASELRGLARDCFDPLQPSKDGFNTETSGFGILLQRFLTII